MRKELDDGHEVSNAPDSHTHARIDLLKDHAVLESSQPILAFFLILCILHNKAHFKEACKRNHKQTWQADPEKAHLDSVAQRCHAVSLESWVSRLFISYWPHALQKV